MIEKIARALADVDATHAWREAHPNEWELYIEDAKAALKALEQPTPEMIEAGLRVVQYYAHEGRAMSDEWLVSSIHEAMIRAASVEDET